MPRVLLSHDPLGFEIYHLEKNKMLHYEYNQLLSIALFWLQQQKLDSKKIIY